MSDTRTGNSWPGSELLFKFDKRYSFILGGVIVAIITVLISVLITKNKTCKLINKYFSSDIFFIVFGSLCGFLEYSLAYFRAFDPVEFQVLITSEMMMNFRIPILLFAGYKLFSKSFFHQFPYICIYGIIGKISIITLSSVFTKQLFLWSLDYDVTYSQMVTFCCVSNIVEPLSIFSFLKKTSERNFYLLLGSFIIGNATAVDVFSASIRISHLHKAVEVPALTYSLLALKPVVDAVIGLLVGVFVGLITAIAKTTCSRREGELYDVGMIFSSTCFVYFFTSMIGKSSLFGVIAVCIVQERYLFMNLSQWSVRTVKVTLEGLSYCIELLFYVFIGYKILSVDFNAVYMHCLLALFASYLAKMVIIGVISFVITIWRKSAIKTAMLGLLLIGGTRGARSYPLIVAYIGPFSRTFQDMILLMIVFSVVVDSLINNILVSMLERRLNRLEDEEDREIHVVPGPLEKTNNTLFEWLREKEDMLHQLFLLRD